MKAVALKLLSMPWGWEALCLIILSLVLTLMTAMAPVEGLFLTILTPPWKILNMPKKLHGGLSMAPSS